jgi:hypothetical protein
MDETVNGFAYRCLPLDIANVHGWCILNSVPFTAQWNGENGLDAIRIEYTDIEGMQMRASSHFGYGILTFHVNGLFRTDPGFDLWVAGPTNMFKDGIQPMSGVIETDWAPSTFTMNWRFTRKHTPIAFERHEPICMFFPVQRGLIETIEPEFCPLESNPELSTAYSAWAASRKTFLEALPIEGSEAKRQGWEKDYFRGLAKKPSAQPVNHRTKINLKQFKRTTPAAVSEE